LIVFDFFLLKTIFIHKNKKILTNITFYDKIYLKKNYQAIIVKNKLKALGLEYALCIVVPMVVKYISDI